ncbi:MAG: hypothetical protein IT258_10380 [Saprospiraceae bacterium]|nr:hypothetical protein [Saprospiraceae bacterium]
MKTTSIFTCFVLACVLVLLSSCSAYQLGQWSQGGSAATSAVGSGYHQANYCPHYPNSPNYTGGMARGGAYAMRGESYPFCHKCRH